MSREDYVIDSANSKVLFKGEAVASYNSVTGAVEYLGAGKKRSRWIKEALSRDLPELKETKEEVTEDIAYDVQSWQIDFYEVFPDAPRPKDNKVGYTHPEVAEWIAVKHANIYDILYPFGVWDAHRAGQGHNLTHPKKGVATSIEING